MLVATSPPTSVLHPLDPHLHQIQAQTGAIAVWVVYWHHHQSERSQQLVVNHQHPAYHPGHLNRLLQDVQSRYAHRDPALTRPSLQLLNPTSLPQGHGLYTYPFNSPLPGETYSTIWCAEPLEQAAQDALSTACALLGQILSTEQMLQQRTARLEMLQGALKRSRHQLRNPLALIQLYAGNLALGLGENPAHAPLQQQVRVIQETAQALGENLQKLLSLHDQGEWQPETFELLEVMQDVVQNLTDRCQANNLTIELPETPLQVWGDRWRLKQVFEILLCNGIAFSPPDSPLTWQWQAEGQRVLITLRDRGPGIPPEQLGEIFQPFYSQRPGGTGLGLAIAQDLVQQHYGHLWAQNHAQGGAQFCLTLPHHNPERQLGVLGEFCL